MKDTVISKSQKKQELIILLVCFIAAFLFNIYAIIRYSSPLKEIFTQLHIVLMLTVIFYVILAFLRIIWWLLTKIYVRFIKS